MKQKLIPLLLFLVAIVTGAKASTVDDLVAISSDYTFIADAVTDNGTTKLTANTLYADGHIFTSTGNSVATNKGSSTFGGASHLNSLRIKNTQDVLAFKVSKACTVTFYTQSHGSRGLKVGTTNGGNEYGSQTTGTSTYEVDVNAGVVYLSSFEGDFYIAGFVVAFPSATTKPTFTTDLSATADVTVGVAETFTVATDNATSYQWYVGGTAVDGATSASYEYTATEAGDVEIYCVATNSVGSTNSTTCTVTASAPASAPSITTDLESAYNVQKSKTLTLSIVAENASSYQWYLDGEAIDGATSASYTFTAGSTIGATNDIYCAVSNAAGTVNSATATVTTTGSNACKLTAIQFSNTAYGAIAEADATLETDASVTVPYMAGTSVPTVVNASVEVSEGATFEVGEESITVTAEDGVTSTEYAIVATAITPLEVAADIATTNFTEVPSWVYNHYGYDSTKGVKFAKAVNDATARITLGNTRQYYFVEAAKTLTLTSGTSSRAINVYRNGTQLSAPTASGDSGSTISIDLDETAPCMIMIESNQTGGDGGFTAYAVTAATAPAFTTDLSATASATVGTAKTFTVVATGATSYQWYTCDDAEGTNAEAIEGETSASYEYTAAAEGTEYIFCAATNSVGTTNSTVCAVTAEAAAVVLNVSAIINNQTGTLLEEEELVQGTQVNFGVDANGARVDANSDDAVIIIDAKYHSDHGLSNFSTLQVKAPGAVKIYIGECTYSTGNIVVKNSANETVAEVTPEATCWKNDHTKVAEITYEGEATTLSISGMGYCPFIGVESITVEPETTDFDNTPATFSWTVGNESEATIVGGVSSAVKSTKVKVGSDLVAGTASYADPGSGTLVTYVPGTSNPGNVATDMIEYTIKMAKGTTFTPTSVSYDAVKVGTDNATYSWSYTVDGTESAITTVSKDDLVRNNNSTGTPALRHTEDLTSAEAGQVVTVRFYVSGFGNTKTFALGNIEINGLVNGTIEQRSFTDFKVDFRTNPYTTILPTTGELPTGVEVTVPSYNGAQHGAQGATTIVVPVDGPVKFTIGNCGYSTKMTVTNSANETIAEVANNGSCENAVSDISTATYNSYATYTYNNESADVLTFTLNGYLPYFFAEACDYIESVDVKYYDVDGTTLIGTESVEGGSDLVYAYSADNVTVAEGKAFRGWFDGAGTTALKVAEGTPVTEDIKLYAKTSEIEVAEVGKIFNYELNKQYFYAEDHELFSASNGSFHDATHGWSFGSNGSFSVQVAGNAQVVLGLCQYSNEGVINVTDANNTPVGSIASAKASVDGATTAFNYEGEATTLTFTFANGAYVHNVKVYNVSSLPTKDEATGYYIVESGDAAGFLLALNSAIGEGTSENPAKIFLPNGTYDLGNAVGTAISGSYVSIIGESQEGVVIQTTPEQEGLGAADLFLNTGSYNYFQDITLKNNYPYGNTTGRAASFHDQGQYTIFKNCYLNSHQDTYYSHKVGAYFYFEGGKISGCVDYMCGNGKVFYEGVTLVNDNRSTYMTANSELYVYNNCVVENGGSTYYFGRSWDGYPTCIFLNTTLKDNGAKLGSTRWVEAGMNTIYGRAGEYGTKNAEGTDITPESNVITFTKGTTSLEQNTILTAEEAETYSYENFFSSANWDPASVAAQATVVKTSVVNNVVTVPEGIYLVEKDGNFVEIFNGTSYKYDNTGKYTLRMANERGGFGEAVEMISGAAAPVQDGETITLTVSANMNGYRAYVNTESNYTVDGNTQVYLPVSKTNNEVNLEPIDIAVVPANMPVILVTSAEPNTDGTYTITLTTTDADATAINAVQYLQLTEEGVAVNGYRLGYKANSGVKFYKYVATNPEPGKIYLNMSDLPEGTPSADALQIEFELEATGINEVGAAKAVVDGKFIKAGKLVIMKAGKAFNAAGATLK